MNFSDPAQLSSADLEKAQVTMEVAVDGKSVGSMTLEFWPQVAPQTVRNFLAYAGSGFYDGLGFHRIIENFMVQGGCPKGTGTGSGPNGNIPGEFQSDPQYSHQRGVISMARSQNPDSASCQFFICHGDASFLDGQYAAFGKLVDGDEVLEKIATVSTGVGAGGENSKPKQAVTILKMSVQEKGAV